MKRINGDAAEESQMTMKLDTVTAPRTVVVSCCGKLLDVDGGVVDDDDVLLLCYHCCSFHITHIAVIPLQLHTLPPTSPLRDIIPSNQLYFHYYSHHHLHYYYYYHNSTTTLPLIPHDSSSESSFNGDNDRPFG